MWGRLGVWARRSLSLLVGSCLELLFYLLIWHGVLRKTSSLQDGGYMYSGWCALAHLCPTYCLLRCFFLEETIWRRAKQCVDEALQVSHRRTRSHSLYQFCLSKMHHPSWWEWASHPAVRKPHSPHIFNLVSLPSDMVSWLHLKFDCQAQTGIHLGWRYKNQVR